MTTWKRRWWVDLRYVKFKVPVGGRWSWWMGIIYLKRDLKGDENGIWRYGFWFEELMVRHLFYLIQLLKNKYKVLNDWPFVVAYYFVEELIDKLHTWTLSIISSKAFKHHSVQRRSINLDPQSISTFLFTRFCEEGILIKLSHSMLQDNGHAALRAAFCRSSNVRTPTQLWWELAQKPSGANVKIFFDDKRYFKVLNKGYQIGNIYFSRLILLCERHLAPSLTDRDLWDCHEKPRWSKKRLWGLHWSIWTFKGSRVFPNQPGRGGGGGEAWNLLSTGH